MLEIKVEIEKEILLKNRRYTLLTGDDENFLEKICKNIYQYFNNIKNGDKIEIYNYYSKIPEIFYNKKVILVDSQNLELELTLNTKTTLYKRFSNYFKKNIPLEPTLLTINSMIEELDLEDEMMDMVKSIGKYYGKNLEINFEKLTPSDFIKKIKIIKDENMDNLDKLKLHTGILDEEDDMKLEKIFIFLFPERAISSFKMKELKKFLLKLSVENQVIVASFSKELIKYEDLDSFNIYLNKKLCNSLLENEVIESLEENYPLLIPKEIIVKKLKYILRNHLDDALGYKKITNVINYEEDTIYIPDYEYMFLLLFYLKKSNIPYKKEVEYDENSPFSCYIEKEL